MHCRITKINHKPDSIDDLLEYLKSVESDVISIEGLHSVTMVNISETESIAFSEYENEEQMNNAGEKYREIMGGMAQYFSGPPEMSNGDAVWYWSK